MHVAMIPWVAVGHITPFIHVGNSLAAVGHRVSLLLPEKPSVQLTHLNLHPSLFTFHTLTLPPFPNLPAGAQTASDVHISATPLLAAAFDLARPAVGAFLAAARPDAVFYDFAHWLPALAAEVGAVAVFFSVVSAASVAFALVPARAGALTAAEMAAPPAGYPSAAVVLRGPDVKSLMFLSLAFGEGGITFFERVTGAMGAADAICFRTCREIEGPLCDYLAEQYPKPLLLTGPVLPPTGGAREQVFISFSYCFLLAAN